MPPTFPAAIKTTSGLVCAMKRWTASDCRRSSSRLVAQTMLQFSRSSRRTMAAPTIPAWPATQTRLPRNSKTTGALMRFCHPSPKLPSPKLPSSKLVMRVVMAAVAAQFGEIRLDHFAHEFVEFHLVSPTEPLARLARIAKERVRFGRAKIARIDFDEHAAITLI